MKLASAGSGWLLGLMFVWLPMLGQAGETTAERSPVLVDPTWVAQWASQPNVRLLEVGQREDYVAGHIQGAMFVDWIVDITDPACPQRYNAAPREQFEALLRRLGISDQTTIVLYDRLQSRLATRMFWTLRCYGHQRIKILDGGAQAWLSAGKTLVTSVPTVSPTQYQLGHQVSKMEVDRAFIRANLSRPQFVLIDGRPVEQYTGEQPGKVYHTGKHHARLGHLPRALNIPWADNLTADGRFKSVNELRKLYMSRSITKDATIVTYCNEGLHAAHPWFVLSVLLDYQDVRLYDDSLSEWANLASEPLVVSGAFDVERR
ncbi:MAG: sulfurtransferase [Planctomycetota bacterium]